MFLRPQLDTGRENMSGTCYEFPWKEKKGGREGGGGKRNCRLGSKFKDMEQGHLREAQKKVEEQALNSIA